MHATSTGLDHGLHQFKRVEYATETSFCVGHDGREVVDVVFAASVNAFGVLDFISTAEGVVDGFNDFWHRVHGVQRLVGVHAGIGVVVSSNLPARQVDGLHASLDLLHGLTTGQCAEAVHIVFGVQQIPQLFGATTGHGVLNGKRTAQTNNISSAVTALDAFPAGVGGPVFFEGFNLLSATQLFGKTLWHVNTPWLINRTHQAFDPPGAVPQF